MTRPRGDALFAPSRKQRAVAHAFVLEAIEPAAPETRPMFGCTAVYVAEKIVLVLRDKGPSDPDGGVWLATTPEHHASLRRDLPSLRSIQVFGSGVTGWQVVPADAIGFEEEALRAAAMILAGDPRIGKTPKPRSRGRSSPETLRKKATPMTTPRTRSASQVESYLAGLPEPRRHAIAAVRQVVLASLPAGYEESFDFGMLSYQVPLRVYPETYNGRPLMYAALASQKSHMALYLCNAYGLEKVRRGLEAGFAKAGKKLDMGKSCIRFKALEDLPLEVIGKAVAATPMASYVEFDRALRSKGAVRARAEARSKAAPARAKARAKPARAARR